MFNCHWQQDWASRVNHVLNVENNYLLMEPVIDMTMNKSIIVTENGDSDSDSDTDYKERENTNSGIEELQ